MWVMQFGTINGTAATGYVLAVVAAVVVGGVNIFGGSGTILGAALGAYFLGFVANALILVGLRSSGCRRSTGWSSSSRSAPTSSSRAASSASPQRGGPDDRRDQLGAASGSLVLRALARWETLLLVVLLGLIVLGTQLSPVFLTPRNFANLLAALMEVAIMALPMTLVIIAGEIDLSVESMAGLACAVLGFLWAAGVPS